MSSYIDPFAIDYLEIAFDDSDLLRLFLTYYCKALSDAVCVYENYHMIMIW